MNGTREASRQWSQRVESAVATKEGFLAVKNACGLFYQPEWHDAMVTTSLWKRGPVTWQDPMR